MQQRSSAPDVLSPKALEKSHGEGEFSSVDKPVFSSERPVQSQSELPVEVGGRDGPEPTRFGDWEKAGRCIDF